MAKINKKIRMTDFSPWLELPITVKSGLVDISPWLKVLIVLKSGLTTYSEEGKDDPNLQNLQGFLDLWVPLKRLCL